MNKNNWLILLGITVLHFLLKLFFPDDISLWYNEVMNVLNTQKTWTEVLDTNTTQQIQPLYWLVLSGWIKIVGFSDENLQLLSILISTITAGSLSFLAMKHFNQNVFLYATLLFLVSGLDLHYSHEVQFYALNSLLCVWSFYFFFEIWEKNDWKSTAFLLIINSLLLYNHPLNYLILVIQLIVVLSLSWKQKGVLLKVVLAQIVAFGMFIPWLLRIIAEPYQLIQQATWSDLINGLIDMAMGGDILILYGLLFLVLGSGIIFYQFKKNQIENTQLMKAVTLILWVFFPIIASFLIAVFFQKSFFFQNVLYITLGFVLLVGLLLEKFPIPQMYKLVPFAILILVLLTRLQIKDYNHQDIKKAIVESQELLKNNGAVFLQTADIDVLFAYYYNQQLLFKDYKNIRQKLAEQHIYVGNDATWMKYQELKNYTKVLLIQSFEGYTDPEGTLVKKFEETFKRTGFNNKYLGVRLYEYMPIQLKDNSPETILKGLPKIQEDEKVLAMIEVINNKNEWLQRVILKAKERNLSLDIMKCLDAVFVLKEEYPQFNKYSEKAILEQVNVIYATSTWMTEINKKAQEKKVSVDIMVFLDALFALQQEDFLFQQKFIGKYNYIQSDEKWKNEVIKKAKERNISFQRMTCIDALYSLNEEEQTFNLMKQQAILKKVEELDNHLELKNQLQNQANQLKLDKEIIFFLEAIKTLNQEQSKVQ